MFYLLDKPKGITSFGAIKDFSRKNNITKIGHTGTLDPLATGLLLVATDEDTKLIDYIDKGFKTYVATMVLGKESDTYDIEGKITSEKEVNATEEEIEKAILSFVGKQDQMPPIFSAKRVNGKRAYDLARQGKEVKLKTSKVEIKEIKDIKFISKTEVSFEVEVSRGTYIRSLIHDIGEKLNTGALMSELRRTKIGHLNESQLGKPVGVFHLLTIDTISTDRMKDLVNGKKIPTKLKEGLYALKYKNDIFGIVQVEKSYIKPKKLFGNKFREAGF
ncbi:MAG: tRNA pseudouridine(55) synthase TruB [Mycoplasmataceae bacterium]|nr:tRNA pseudouridine(55) synthase TruB [Mycoplasmataceae bacterium]